MSSWAASEQVAGRMPRIDRAYDRGGRIRVVSPLRTEVQLERHGVVLVGDQRGRSSLAEARQAGVGIEEDAGLLVEPAGEDQELGVERPAVAVAVGPAVPEERALPLLERARSAGGSSIRTPGPRRCHSADARPARLGCARTPWVGRVRHVGLAHQAGAISCWLRSSGSCSRAGRPSGRAAEKLDGGGDRVGLRVVP